MKYKKFHETFFYWINFSEFICLYQLIIDYSKNDEFIKFYNIMNYW
jgi:hypothetical protein